jgi:hypothetical protein
MRKLALIRELAEETDRLHVGGVIDRDHWDVRHQRRFAAEAPRPRSRCSRGRELLLDACSASNTCPPKW